MSGASPRLPLQTCGRPDPPHEGGLNSCPPLGSALDPRLSTFTQAFPSHQLRVVADSCKIVADTQIVADSFRKLHLKFPPYLLRVVRIRAASVRIRAI